MKYLQVRDQSGPSIEPRGTPSVRRELLQSTVVWTVIMKQVEEILSIKTIKLSSEMLSSPQHSFPCQCPWATPATSTCPLTVGASLCFLSFPCLRHPSECSWKEGFTADFLTRSTLSLISWSFSQRKPSPEAEKPTSCEGFRGGQLHPTETDKSWKWGIRRINSTLAVKVYKM